MKIKIVQSFLMLSLDVNLKLKKISKEKEIQRKIENWKRIQRENEIDWMRRLIVRPESLWSKDSSWSFDFCSTKKRSAISKFRLKKKRKHFFSKNFLFYSRGILWNIRLRVTENRPYFFRSKFFEMKKEKRIDLNENENLSMSDFGWSSWYSIRK